MPVTAGEITLTEGTGLAADVSPSGDRIAMDLLGSIWLLPARGGQADKIINNLQPAANPRWSPDGSSILYQTRSAFGSQIWVRDLEHGTSQRLSEGGYFDHQADWHPDGNRIVFSSQRDDRGFDLWETHLPTGLSWRVTQDRGDETWPAWSANGRDLAYVRMVDDEWRLVLRPHGQPEQTLLVSSQPLAAPSWRPDGSLLTFLRKQEGRYVLDMVILSDPPVIHPLAAGEDFFLAPVSWRDRLHLFYTADGVIKQRRFNDWKSSTLGFRATVGQPAHRGAATIRERRVSVLNPSPQRLVIRTSRLFDGETPGYRENLDVVIENGRIAAVRPRGPADGATVLDLGDTTLLPGFIDVYARLDEANAKAMGLRLLSYGVTTLVAANNPEALQPGQWDTSDSPGPRFLRAAPIDTGIDSDAAALPTLAILPAAGVTSVETADPVRAWQSLGVPVLAESFSTGLLVGADLMLGADNLPASPLGRHYADMAVASGNGPVTLVSGLANAATPGLVSLLKSRQAALTPVALDDVRHYAVATELANATSTVVVGSQPNGLPAGMALHAELRALAAAGFGGDRLLRAAGADAADVLGLGKDLGRITPGAVADLVIVAGDPRADITNALDIVAVVRSGYFYSLVRLLEDARSAAGVE